MPRLSDLDRGVAVGLLDSGYRTITNRTRTGNYYLKLKI